MSYSVRQLDYLTAHTTLSPIRHGFAPGFVSYKKGCTRLAAASDKVYQLLAHGRWLSPASSTTKTGRHDISEILLKVALNTNNQSIIIVYIKINIFAICNQLLQNNLLHYSSDQFKHILLIKFRSRCCPDRMVVGFTTSCAIHAYHH